MPAVRQDPNHDTQIYSYTTNSTLLPESKYIQQAERINDYLTLCPLHADKFGPWENVFGS